MQRFIQYIKDTRAELRHVRWPSRKIAFIITILVVIVSLATAAFLGFFDFVFSDVLVDTFFIR